MTESQFEKHLGNNPQHELGDGDARDAKLEPQREGQGIPRGAVRAQIGKCISGKQITRIH